MKKDTTEYVLYLRRSSDENSNNQVQSIPAQEELCLRYAKEHNLIIKKKNEAFYEIEDKESFIPTDMKIKRDEKEKKKLTKKEQEIKSLFIIRESHSAKLSGTRPKRKKIIELIKQGRIKGILSYSPDRQSRNMKDGAEIIDLAKQDKVNLRYTNFNFENNSSGRMMLGFRTVFASQYVEKLSEDTTRGFLHGFSKGKALGKYKHGYVINDKGYHQPHPQYFPLMRDAFDMKIYEKKSDREIADYLNNHGLRREYKSGKTEKINPKNLHKYFKDTFYFGLFKMKDNVVDLREKNEYYEPLISEAEYSVLMERYKNPRRVSTSGKKDEIIQQLVPFPSDFFIDEAEFGLSPGLPSRSRFKKRLEKAREQDDTLRMVDIVKPHQIYFQNNNKSPHYKLSIQYDRILNAFKELIQGFIVDDEVYKIYEDAFSEYFGDISKKRDKSHHNKLLLLKKRQKERRSLMRSKNLYETDEEKQQYKERLDRLGLIIKTIEQDIKELGEIEYQELVAQEEFKELYNDFVSLFRGASYGTKGEMVKQLINKVIVTKNKEIKIVVKKDMAVFFGGLKKRKKWNNVFSYKYK